MFFLLKEKPSHQNSPCILRLSQEKKSRMSPSKNCPLLSGNLKTNHLNNTLHSTSRFAANFVKVGIKGGEPGREGWIRIKQNVTGKNYKVKMPFVHTMEHNFVVDIFKACIVSHSVPLKDFMCRVKMNFILSQSMNLPTCYYLQPFLAARVLARLQHQSGIKVSKLAGCPTVQSR